FLVLVWIGVRGRAVGRARVHCIVHDGRKHAAGIGLVGHDRDDLGDEETRGLLAYRFVARTADPVLAARALAFLGLPPGDEDLLRIVTTELSPVGAKDRAGELLGRDPRMRISRFQVLVPELARLLDAIFTSPSSPSAGERPGRAAPMDRAAGLVPSTGGR
ncbi:ATP-binding protein, partial [Streptomyces violascens]|uniref:ATP-binding protein n=1 Tax=Streptomyces violascens TaxID=67381 RepID=UPI0036D18C1D